MLVLHCYEFMIMIKFCKKIDAIEYGVFNKPKLTVFMTGSVQHIFPANSSYFYQGNLDY